MGKEKVYPHSKENEYGIFDWRLSSANAYLLDNLVPDSESQTTVSIFFNSRHAMTPYNSDYYIFDSHSRDGLGQSSENGYSILLKFVTIEHVLNFITTTYIPVGTCF